MPTISLGAFLREAYPLRAFKHQFFGGQVELATGEQKPVGDLTYDELMDRKIQSVYDRDYSQWYLCR